jgi:DNA repair photolyase
MRWDRDDGQMALFGAEHRQLPDTEYMPVNAKRIINTVPGAQRLPFRYTINAYRGCRHACVYCFARPTHEFLGMNLGEDFERRIVVKVNAVEKLRAELADPAWEGELIAMGTNTDPYQPAEGRYRLTEGLIQELSAARNPFSILTKSTMILRDLDLLVDAKQRTRVGVSLSIGTIDDDVARRTEPGAAPPSRRLEAVAKLAEAGLSPSVLLAPILPGLSDDSQQLRSLTRACLDAGASSVTPIVLHLRRGVREHYLGWLEEHEPQLAGQHRQAYSGAYLPRREQARITEAVRAEISATAGGYRGGSGSAGGGRTRSRPRTRPVP